MVMHFLSQCSYSSRHAGCWSRLKQAQKHSEGGTKAKRNVKTMGSKKSKKIGFFLLRILRARGKSGKMRNLTNLHKKATWRKSLKIRNEVVAVVPIKLLVSTRFFFLLFWSFFNQLFPDRFKSWLLSLGFPCRGSCGCIIAGSFIS